MMSRAEAVGLWCRCFGAIRGHQLNWRLAHGRHANHRHLTLSAVQGRGLPNRGIIPAGGTHRVRLRSLHLTRRVGASRHRLNRRANRLIWSSMDFHFDVGVERQSACRCDGVGDVVFKARQRVYARRFDLTENEDVDHRFLDQQLLRTQIL